MKKIVKPPQAQRHGASFQNTAFGGRLLAQVHSSPNMETRGILNLVLKLNKKLSKWGIFFILVLALGLRLISINQSLWLDEATSGLVVRNLSFSQIITQFSPADFHPPLYYLILKVWSMSLGTSEIALRSLSVLAGVLTVYLVYLIGNLLDKTSIKKKFGIIASLLLATSGLHIYYSQEARMYALACLFVVLAVYFFIKILETENISNWFGFSLSITLMVFIDYLPFLMLPVFWVWAYFSHKKLNWWKKFTFSHLLLVIAFILWAPLLLQQLSVGLSVGSNAPGWWKILGLTSLKTIGLIPVKFILGRISFANRIVYGFISFMVSAIYLGVVGLTIVRLPCRGNPYKVVRGVWLWFVGPVIGSLVLGLKIPVLSYFRLLFVLPAFYLLLALGISSFKGYVFKMVLILILLINLSSSFYYLFNPKFHREDWRGLVKYIQNKSQGKDSITLFPADSQMEAYRYYDPDGKIAGPGGLGKEYDRIWLMRYVQDIFDPDDNLRKSVEENGYKMIKEHNFNGVVVWEYELGSEQ